MSYIIWLVVGYFIGYVCINFIRWLCSPDSTVQESKEEIKATKAESTENHSELNEVRNRLIKTTYNAFIGLLPKIYAQDNKVMTEE